MHFAVPAIEAAQDRGGAMSHGTGTFGLTKVNESADILLVIALSAPTLLGPSDLRDSKRPCGSFRLIISEA